jgi:hypothetical protein
LQSEIPILRLAHAARDQSQNLNSQIQMHPSFQVERS